MTKHKEREYRKTTVRYDGFSTAEKAGKMCATHAYGVTTKSGKLAQGQGLSYLAHEGADVRLPEGETLQKLGIVPNFLDEGRFHQPIISTRRAVMYYAASTKTFTNLLTASPVCRFLALPMPSGDVMAGILLPGSLWTYGVLNWVRKGCDGSFTSAACVYGNRLFVVDTNNVLLYSAPYEYANFTDSADEGGRLTVADPIDPFRQLIAIGDEMYCLTRKRIFCLEGRGAARDFTLREVPYAGDAILEGSGAAFGDRLVFLTGEGMYSVQKGKATRLSASVPVGQISTVGAEAVATGDVYYFPCLVNGEKRTLCVDAEEGGCSYTQYTPVLCAYDGEAYGMAEDGRFFVFRHGCPLPQATFVKQGERFGDGRDKTLKILRLYGEGEVTLSVAGRNARREKTLTLTPFGEEIKVSLKGKAFDIAISPKVGSVVTAIEADIVQLIG